LSKLITYIDHLQKCNADDLAFYPVATLEKALEQRRILTCYDNDECAGYLWHGSVRAGYDMVIYQACVDYDSRRRTLGWDMVKSLLDICREGGGSGVRLRCASSSNSNEFWQGIGFYCTKVSQGGIKRGRQINDWRTDVHPTLFKVDSVQPSTQPIDLTNYQKQRQQGVNMPSIFSRRHY
jgi:ribosomal protein S18 acetylase RimI-like enzyme